MKNNKNCCKRIYKNKINVYMQVEVSGFLETKHSIVFCIYENKIFLLAYEVCLKSLGTVLEYSV